jgi:hypothetical protein
MNLPLLSRQAAAMQYNPAARRFPGYGFFGLGLTGVGWFLAWVRPAGWEFCSENAFFVLWLGYILVVNGICRRWGGNPPLERCRAGFFGMFLLSIPGWWLFEFFNRYLQNWHYLLNRPVGPVEYAVRASIHFSIVIPAVLSTAELWHRFPWPRALTRGPKMAFTPGRQATALVCGLLMLAGVLLFPRYCFPLVWVGVWLVLDSLNYRRGAPALFRFLEQGDLRPFLELSLGSLTCGFFWEFWNYYALPKWVYTVPFVDFLHLFEMPALGYLGYLPFGLEVFSLYIFLAGLAGLPNASLYRAGAYAE